jgi:hypothetical protein
MTALNHTLQDAPKLTSPTIVALSATKQSSGIRGDFPFTDFINIKFLYLVDSWTITLVLHGFAKKIDT